MLMMEEPQLQGLLNWLSTKQEFVFLDTSRPDEQNSKSYLFVEPLRRHVCHQGDDLCRYLEMLQQELDRGCWLAGWMGYEFGALLEAGLKGTRESGAGGSDVLADFGVFLKPLEFDHATGVNEFPSVVERSETTENFSISGLQPNMAREEFVEALEKVRSYIGAGDTYQVNYTMKLHFDFDGPAEALYTALRRNQSVAYGAFIRSRDEELLSFSPELFFRRRGAEVTAKPMKGTAPRGVNLESESGFIDFLCNDTKNRSENVMIVDLLRNDLGRLVYNGDGKGRVRVDSLFDVESYESLLQMTSTVKATCTPPEASSQLMSLPKLFRALFPCGSITGAPKIRTMEIIAELEKERRGVYTGAIGFFSPEGNAAFNVPIRTVRLVDGRGEMGVGAGITYDSVPTEEWDESLLKGRFLTHADPAFSLIETLLYLHDGEPQGSFFLLEKHLVRLERSARFFKFTCDLPKIFEKLNDLKEILIETSRVRLLLHKDGRFDVTVTPCAAPQMVDLPVRPEALDAAGLAMLPEVGFATELSDQHQVWRYHKSTRRESYDRWFSLAQQEGLVDYLFCNSLGQVCEGCITNVLVYLDGRYVTPSLTSGVLAGTMRAALLDTDPDAGESGISPTIVEAELTPADLLSAEAVYLCNSVRGVVRVRLRQDGLAERQEA